MLLKNEFIPRTGFRGAWAVASTPGVPEKTITWSARYDATMKSCSMTKAVFLEWKMKRLMTFAMFSRCSESK
jgi:hypothetical protein